MSGTPMDDKLARRLSAAGIAKPVKPAAGTVPASDSSSAGSGETANVSKAVRPANNVTTRPVGAAREAADPTIDPLGAIELQSLPAFVPWISKPAAAAPATATISAGSDAASTKAEPPPAVPAIDTNMEIRVCRATDAPFSLLTPFIAECYSNYPTYNFCLPTSATLYHNFFLRLLYGEVIIPPLAENETGACVLAYEISTGEIMGGTSAVLEPATAARVAAAAPARLLACWLLLSGRGFEPRTAGLFVDVRSFGRAVTRLPTPSDTFSKMPSVWREGGSFTTPPYVDPFADPFNLRSALRYLRVKVATVCLVLATGPLVLSRILGYDARGKELNRRFSVALSGGAAWRTDSSMWRVDTVFVRPLYRGRGVCRQLLAAVCGGADAAMAPLYLSTSSATKNVPMYQRLGFHVVGAVTSNGDFLDAATAEARTKRLRADEDADAASGARTAPARMLQTTGLARMTDLVKCFHDRPPSILGSQAPPPLRASDALAAAMSMAEAALEDGGARWVATCTAACACAVVLVAGVVRVSRGR
jgi:GNAT superfamily N-acetyltransferase